MSRSVSTMWAKTKASRGCRHVVIRHLLLVLLVGSNLSAESNGPAAPPHDLSGLQKGLPVQNTTMQGCQSSPWRESRCRKVCVLELSMLSATKRHTQHTASRQDQPPLSPPFICHSQMDCTQHPSDMSLIYIVRQCSRHSWAHISPMRHQPHIKDAMRAVGCIHRDAMCAGACQPTQRCNVGVRVQNRHVMMRCVQVGSDCA